MDNTNTWPDRLEVTGTYTGNPISIDTVLAALGSKLPNPHILLGTQGPAGPIELSDEDHATLRQGLADLDPRIDPVKPVMPEHKGRINATLGITKGTEVTVFKNGHDSMTQYIVRFEIPMDGSYFGSLTGILAAEGLLYGSANSPETNKFRKEIIAPIAQEHERTITSGLNRQFAATPLWRSRRLEGEPLANTFVLFVWEESESMPPQIVVFDGEKETAIKLYWGKPGKDHRFNGYV